MRGNSNIGRAIFALLDGMSGTEEDPNFLASGQEGPQTKKSSSTPFKGTGPFGGLKANQANSKFLQQKALSQFNSYQDFENFKKQLDYQNDKRLAFIKAQNEIASGEQEKELGREGEAYGIGMGILKPDEINQIFPNNQQFSGPADQGRYMRAAFGPGKSLLDISKETNPAYRAGGIREGASKGYIHGGAGVFDPVNREAITLPSFQPHQSVEQFPTGQYETGIDLATGQPFKRPILTTKTTSENQFQPGGSTIIPPATKITAEDVNAYPGARTNPLNRPVVGPSINLQGAGVRSLQGPYEGAYAFGSNEADMSGNMPQFRVPPAIATANTPPEPAPVFPPQPRSSILPSNTRLKDEPTPEESKTIGATSDVLTKFLKSLRRRKGTESFDEFERMMKEMEEMEKQKKKKGGK